MWHKRIALALAVLALALLVLSGLGVRAGLWPFRVGFGMFAGALVAGLAAAGVAAVALAVPRLRAGSLSLLVFSLLLGLASAAVPLDHVRRVKTLPYINDVSTDTERVPEFTTLRPSPEYPRHFAELQRIGYPGLRPLEVSLPPAEAFARALAAARAARWDITLVDEKSRTIEAVATTRWFGFKDDVVVRVAAAGGGSRIDLRSRSRVGRSDLGANAKRIQDFLTGVERWPAYHRRGMSTDFKLTPRADYLHVELAPGYEIKPEGTTQLAFALSDACARQGRRRVLIEGTVARRSMGTMDSFSFGSLMGSALTGGAVACCLYGYVPDQQTQFFKDVSQNRGVRIEFFKDRDAALRWLGVDPRQQV